jgi:ribosomal protein S18 acetylase RimI-like enzyme
MLTRAADPQRLLLWGAPLASGAMRVDGVQDGGEPGRTGPPGSTGSGPAGALRRALSRRRAVPPPSIAVRPLAWDDGEAAEALLDAALAGRHQRRLGAEHDVLGYPGFAAWQGDELAGLATWSHERPRAELVALVVAEGHRGLGVGAALVEWVAAAGRKHGTHVLWLVTTNDNLDALRLYQRHAFRLVALHPGAIDTARAEKPAIPRTGAHGIPLRDELVLERRL